jgi:hypothetical protein
MHYGRKESAGNKNTPHRLRQKLKTEDGINYRDLPEYGSWIAMRKRCYYKKDISYKNYGGKGITVCDRWNGLNGFSNFLEDMGRMPGYRWEVDRKEKTGNYCKDNCQWLSKVNNLRKMHKDKHARGDPMNEYLSMEKETIDEDLPF